MAIGSGTSAAISSSDHTKRPDVNAKDAMGYNVPKEDNVVELTSNIFKLLDSRTVTTSYYGKNLGNGSESNLRWGYLHEWRYDLSENAAFFKRGDVGGGESEANSFADKMLKIIEADHGK